MMPFPPRRGGKDNQNTPYIFDWRQYYGKDCDLWRADDPAPALQL